MIIEFVMKSERYLINALNNDKKTTLTTSIRNDGGKAIIREIVWQNDSVCICIGGKEQQDIVYLITFNEDKVNIQF